MVGENVDVAVQVQNQGNGAANSTSQVGYYLANTCAPPDLSNRFGSDTVQALDPGQSDAESDSYTFTSNDVGTRYFLAKADYLDDVPESDEINNVGPPGCFGPFDVVVPPNITVTTPNGGETWTKGSNQTITWTDNIDENVKIELLKGGVLVETIHSSTPSDGTLPWMVSQGLATGSDYRIQVTSTVDVGVSDASDGDFTIDAPGSVTRYVAPTGSDTDNDCTDPLNPCATLAHAVSEADDGDTIDLAPGTYTLSMSVLIDKALNIQGQGVIVQ